jgi:hypothetical protein
VVTVKVLAALWFAGAAAVAGSQDPYEGGELYAVPRPYEMQPLKSVTVTSNGAWTDEVSGEETPDSCASFRLTTHKVRAFFEQARRASHKEYVHDLDMSRCYASGELVLSNGDRGVWRIDRARRGSIGLADGRRLYFYCAACKGLGFHPR